MTPATVDPTAIISSVASDRLERLSSWRDHTKTIPPWAASSLVFCLLSALPSSSLSYSLSSTSSDSRRPAGSSSIASGDLASTMTSRRSPRRRPRPSRRWMTWRGQSISGPKVRMRQFLYLQSNTHTPGHARIHTQTPTHPRNSLSLPLFRTSLMSSFLLC